MIRRESYDTKMQILNRDVVKYIAMFTMLLNHIALIFSAGWQLAGGAFYGYRLFYGSYHVLFPGRGV